MDSLKKKWKSTRRYKGGVSIDEITNVVAILYMLIEMIAERMESVKKRSSFYNPDRDITH